MKILFLHKQILFPHDTGGKIRALNILRHLARWHDVTYLSNLRPGEEAYVPEMEALGLTLETAPVVQSKHGSLGYYAAALANIVSPDPYTISRNFDPALRDRAAALVRDGRFDLLICDTIVMEPHVRDLAGPVRVLFQHNVEAQIYKRHAETGPPGPKRAYMADQFRKMARFEAACGPRFDGVIAISENDRRRFEADYGWRHVEAIDTSVDLDYFRPAERPPVADRVVFVGSMDWLPNQDGVRWFLREVWPLVRKERPGATLQVVGRRPPAEFQKASGVDGVEVVGTVPDVRPYLAEAAVSVVPLLVGGGTRLKIFEAMASGKAVVSTTLGAEGLPLTPGEHFLQVDEAPAFASAVAGLLADPGRRDALGAAALRLVQERFGTEPIARQFEAICLRACERAGAAAPAGAKS